jgi:RHS repeat-associated protein
VLDINSAFGARYLYGPGVDDVNARVMSNGTVAWYLKDYQHSTVVMTDGSGVVQDRIAYDGFGNILSETNSSFGDRFKYTGREWDAVVGLQHNGAREYNPLIAKWTSTDPLGFAAGDANLYRYVGNRSVYALDPSGLVLVLPQVLPVVTGGVGKPWIDGWHSIIEQNNEQIIAFEKLIQEHTASVESAIAGIHRPDIFGDAGLGPVSDALDSLMMQHDQHLSLLAENLIEYFNLAINSDGDEEAWAQFFDAQDALISAASAHTGQWEGFQNELEELGIDPESMFIFHEQIQSQQNLPGQIMYYLITSAFGAPSN